MPALFATFLLVSLVFALAVAFSSPHTRSRWKALLVVSILAVWASFALRVAQIVTRTGNTLVTPGGARQPHLVESAGQEALVLLGSHGVPALVVTALAVLALKASRPRSRA